MDFSADDYRYMARALQLAERGRYTTAPNPNVGCVIVSPAGEIVGEGWHERAGEGHAEVRALAEAGEAAHGARVYVTLEPCAHHGRTPPCAEALVEAGVGHVICAMHDPNPRVAGAGIEKLRAANIRVDEGLLEAQAEQLNAGFVKRMRSGLPRVVSKLAVGIDGRTAMASGESKWITGAAARADVHRLRALSGAVLTGSGTVLADDPRLNARSSDIDGVLQPLRAVADTGLRTPVDAQIVGGGQTVIYHAGGADESADKLAAAGATVVELAATSAGLDPELLLRDLAAREINTVLVEAGPRLNGALLAGGWIDELIVYQAGKVMGGDARGMFDCPQLTEMANCPTLELIDMRRVGTDTRCSYRMN